MPYYPLGTGFLNQVIKLRNDDSTQYLQNQLINYYLGNAAYFIDNNKRNQLPKNHFFGLSWSRFSQWSEIPRLDPQNKFVNNMTIDHLKTEYNQEVIYPFISPSNYVYSITEFYINKAKEEKQSSLYNWPVLSDSRRNTQYYLKTALFFRPDCYLEDLPLFIDYYLDSIHQRLYAQLLIHIDKQTKPPDSSS